MTFEFDKSNILPESYPMLDSLAGWLIDHPEQQARVAGHTDNVGKASYNLELSGKRADAIRQYLIEKGVLADRLQSKGYGDAEPIADNKTPGGRALNRRVEVAFE